MKRSTKFFASLSVLLLAGLNTACVEYAQPICNSTNLVDVSIEGERSFVLYNEFEALKQTAEIVRVAKGTYSVKDSNATFTTCKTSKGIYAEEKSVETDNYVGYYFTSIINGGGVMMSHFVGRATLDDGKVPYEIETRKNPDSESLRGKILSAVKGRSLDEEEDNTYEVLVIKNTKEHNSFLVEKGQFVSVGISFQ